jgi:hypothetical protein
MRYLGACVHLLLEGKSTNAPSKLTPPCSVWSRPSA